VLDLRYGQAFRAMMVGFFFNVLLPARGGDLLRVQYLGKRTGLSRAKLLGTEIVDFWSDKWGWVASFPIVCPVGKPPSWLFRAVLLMGGLVLGIGIVLALMASGLLRRGPRWLTNLRDGFAANHWKRLLVVETVIAPLPWLWETLVIVVAGHAVGLDLSTMQAFAALTAFNIANHGSIARQRGSFEAGGTLALTAFGGSEGDRTRLHLPLPSHAGGARVRGRRARPGPGGRDAVRQAEPVQATGGPSFCLSASWCRRWRRSRTRAELLLLPDQLERGVVGGGHGAGPDRRRS